MDPLSREYLDCNITEVTACGYLLQTLMILPHFISVWAELRAVQYHESSLTTYNIVYNFNRHRDAHHLSLWTCYIRAGPRIWKPDTHGQFPEDYHHPRTTAHYLVFYLGLWEIANETAVFAITLGLWVVIFEQLSLGTSLGTYF